MSAQSKREGLRSWLPVLPVLIIVLLGGCYGMLPDTSERGRESEKTGYLRSETGCTLNFRLYPASGPVSEDLVVLAHGFLRRKERMDHLAEALSAAGISTATLDFCNARPWDGGHVRNGRDMVVLARHLGARRVVYAGFSAGGLAAVLAAAEDTRAAGVLALDLVDQDGLGVRAAGRLDKPLVGLMGDPSACNARGNGMAVLAAGPRTRVERFPGAGHCDFESPTDWLCERICGARKTGVDAPGEKIVNAAVAAAADILRDG
jgi:pimeloyl-ACP methyl ester carboxylesterase